MMIFGWWLRCGVTRHLLLSQDIVVSQTVWDFLFSVVVVVKGFQVCSNLWNLKVRESFQAKYQLKALVFDDMRMRLNNQLFFSRTWQRNCDAVVGESFVFINSVKCLWRRWSISADIRLWKRALFPGVLANIVSLMPPPPYNPAPQINRINMMIQKRT